MKVLSVLLSGIFASGVGAQEIIDIWPEKAPYSKSNTLEEYVKDTWEVPCAYNITRATLTVFPAVGHNSGRAMVILPGGGYVLESIVAEGQVIGEYLSSRGITAAVLKYRLPLAEASDQPELVPITDARRAISFMRSRADRFGFEPSKVGIMGFSAGGHLATAVSVLKSKSSDESPDFSALIYPVTTMSPDNRKWLEETLFHRPMSKEELQQYSLVDHVDAHTPPAFLVHAYDDDVVPIAESQAYAEALTAVGQEVEVHFFTRGGHGFGPGRPGDGTDQWLGLVAGWIRRQ